MMRDDVILCLSIMGGGAISMPLPLPIPIIPTPDLFRNFRPGNKLESAPRYLASPDKPPTCEREQLEANRPAPHSWRVTDSGE